MKLFKHIFSLISLIILLVFTLAQSDQAAVAMASGWQKPEWIPGLVDTTLSQYPVFVADTTGRVHVFHSQWTEGKFGVEYSYWNIGVGWAKPVDILTSDIGQARVTDAFLDNAGMINLFFWGGDDQSAGIYFSKAPLNSVSDSTAWASPIRIGVNAIAPTTAKSVSDQKGNIVSVYSGNIEGNGLYSVTSQDYGVTWTMPTALFFTNNDQLYPSELQMIRTNDQTIHAVWALGDETGNSRRVYYAALPSGQKEWNNPRILAEAISFEADTPTIAEHDNELMVIYHNNFPTTRWMIRSRDEGKTWSAPVRLFPHVGSNGSAAMVEDSSGALHMFFGNRVGSPAVHGLWHSQWVNSSWTVPEAVVSGQQILAGDNGEEGFDPSHAQATIVRGNILLIVWRHDPMAGPQHIWYSYTYLDTPPDLVKSTATSETNITPTVEETPIPILLTTPRPTLERDMPQSTNPDNYNLVLMIGLIPVVILVVITSFIYNHKRNL